MTHVMVMTAHRFAEFETTAFLRFVFFQSQPQAPVTAEGRGSHGHGATLNHYGCWRNTAESLDCIRGHQNGGEDELERIIWVPGVS